MIELIVALTLVSTCAFFLLVCCLILRAENSALLHENIVLRAENEAHKVMSKTVESILSDGPHSTETLKENRPWPSF